MGKEEWLNMVISRKGRWTKGGRRVEGCKGGIQTKEKEDKEQGKPGRMMSN